MRQPKPFFRKFTKTWYVTIRGKQTNLGPDKEAAFQKYHELTASRGMGQDHYPTVALLLDAYLGWVKENRAAGTFEKSVHFLSSFVEFSGLAMSIAAIESLHVISMG